MQVNAYLSFDGGCEAAFKFYEQCLGGQLGAIFRYAGTPLADQVPPDWQDKSNAVTRKFQTTASYLHDSLRDHASAARALVRNKTEATVVFMDQPGEHQLVMRRISDKEVDVKIDAPLIEPAGLGRIA